MQFETYESLTNMNQSRMQKCGQFITFSIDANKCGKTSVIFSQPFVDVPFLTVTPSLDANESADFSLFHVRIENLNKTGFTLRLMNMNMNTKVSGVLSWRATNL